jgi:HD-GYP domain-containing protein (c-di-GMP phosphodiesterase class II)
MLKPVSPSPAIKINFGQFVGALSDTIDLVGIDEIQHGKRVAFMASECAKVMGLTREEQLSLLRIGLLHDCGVSSTRVHKKLVEELDWAESALHCQIGAERMRKFAPLADFADVILHHHSHWQQLQELPFSETTKRNANLIHLLDRVDALAAMQDNPNRLASRDTVCRQISSLGDTYFQPFLIEVFLAAADKEAFWIIQEPSHLMEYLQNQLTDGQVICLETEDLKGIGRLFAQIVDAKSPYTAEHSIGVGALSAYLAKRCGLPDTTCGMVEVAGQLHDLGKLQVPDTILEHNGNLENASLAIMRHHSFVTHTILNRIGGLEEIALWASNHHEKLDGSGYPFRRTADELSIESRIVMVADIYQALAQERPYRKPQSPDKIVGMLRKQASDGQLDPELVRIVECEPAQCHQAAMTYWR